MNVYKILLVCKDTNFLPFGRDFFYLPLAEGWRVTGVNMNCSTVATATVISDWVGILSREVVCIREQ